MVVLYHQNQLEAVHDVLVRNNNKRSYIIPREREIRSWVKGVYGNRINVSLNSL